MKRVENNTFFILITVLLLLSCGRSNQGLIMQNSKRIIDCNIDDAIKQTVFSLFLFLFSCYLSLSPDFQP
jgi:hypothetical protein